MIGAPRANANTNIKILEKYRKFKETGLIYKCFFDNQKCEIYDIDRTENEYDMNNRYFENKNFNWLGASMDGIEINGDHNMFVVRHYFKSEHSIHEYFQFQMFI